jgi:hypothetical protein
MPRGGRLPHVAEGEGSAVDKGIIWLWAAVVAASVLEAAGPALVALARALVPLVIAVGVAAIGVRLVFFHTRRW